MPVFAYRAADRAGRTVDGVMEAFDANAVVERLHREDYYPLRVEATDEQGRRGRRLLGAPRVPSRDVLDFTQQLATLVEAGLPLERALVVLGDVAGKGAPAALLTAVIQGVFSSQAQTGAPPSETLSRVNQALIRRAIESRFCTAFYACVSPDGSLTYCNAGHNPPMVFTANGVTRLEKGGLILGLFEHATFEEDTISLAAGDLLITFSDGVTEAMSASGEEYGEDRLMACVEANRQRSTRELIDAIFASVRLFSVGAVQSDDVTALVVRYEGSN